MILRLALSYTEANPELLKPQMYGYDKINICELHFS